MISGCQGYDRVISPVEADTEDYKNFISLDIRAIVR